MKKLPIMLALLMIILVGCTEDKPRPKGVVSDVIPVQVNNLSEDVVAVVNQTNKNTFDLNYHIREQNVYVECFIPGFIFEDMNSKNRKDKVHLNVTVDGQKTLEIYTAAFILKGLDKGVHDIAVEVMQSDSSSNLMKKTFQIKIR
ncbi:hypothetical protein [Metabacillus litoralis]|uniref:hypothetical protein n=1 Tax=Metabacillus litoralis TaxID=152268 RepID=UPI001CFD1AC6|nr:hypothetical protein [Metabacillus litoralis]